MSSTNTLTYNNSNGLYLVCPIGCEIINEVLSHSTLDLVQEVLVHVHTTFLSSLIYCMTHHHKSYVAKSTSNYLTTIGDALTSYVTTYLSFFIYCLPHHIFYLDMCDVTIYVTPTVGSLLGEGRPPQFRPINMEVCFLICIRLRPRLPQCIRRFPSPSSQGEVAMYESEYLTRGGHIRCSKSSTDVSPCSVPPPLDPLISPDWPSSSSLGGRALLLCVPTRIVNRKQPRWCGETVSKHLATCGVGSPGRRRELGLRSRPPVG